jgi:DNA/RNA endonuclease YhcR with UshA esterase domain
MSKSLVVTKHIQENQHLHQLGSHDLVMDDMQGPIDVEAHAQVANMLVYNDVIENVVATVTAGVLEDIYIPVQK